MQKGVGQYEMPNPIRRRGQHTPATPAIQRGHHANRRGTPHTRRGVSNTTALPSPCHPPSTTAPPTTTVRGRADRGYPTTRTAQTHTHHPHTTHPASDSARHDSSTRQHCSGHGQGTSHTTALGRTAGSTHRHSTHRGGWTPSTHPLITLTHSRSHNR